MGLKEQILGSPAAAPVPVEVPEWGLTLWIRTMSARERDQFEASNIEGSGRNRRPNLDNLRARLLVKVLCDADGKRIFEEADALELGAKSGAVLDRLFDRAREANRIFPDLEELEKNSGTTPAAASP